MPVIKPLVLRRCRRLNGCFLQSGDCDAHGYFCFQREREREINVLQASLGLHRHLTILFLRAVPSCT